jgi:hypothetical protein
LHILKINRGGFITGDDVAHNGDIILTNLDFKIWIKLLSPDESEIIMIIREGNF